MCVDIKPSITRSSHAHFGTEVVFFFATSESSKISTDSSCHCARRSRVSHGGQTHNEMSRAFNYEGQGDVAGSELRVDNNGMLGQQQTEKSVCFYLFYPVSVTDRVDG